MKELLDSDGENRAVRAFLLGRELGIKESVFMKRHMESSGYPFWPDWVGQGNRAHMSKSAQQDWLRHLFSLENEQNKHPDEIPETYNPQGLG